MESFQLLAIIAVFFTVTLMTWRLIRFFKAPFRPFLPVLVLPLFFSVGFSFRLMDDKGVVDLGYFLTELSLIWGIVLYTSTLILGQVRYWEK